VSIRNQNIHSRADFPKQRLVKEIVTAISLTSAVVSSLTPGYRFQIVGVRSFCRTKAGAVSYVVKVGTRTAVAAGVFTAATDVAATLSTTKSNLRGSSSEAITIELTSDGSGVLTNSHVEIIIRPWPLAGDLGPST
jgi:hypothetical protein